MRGRKTTLDGSELLSYGLRALSRRAHSAAELRTKLHARAAEPADVDQVLEKVREYGYLNDEQFAESFASARRDNQGFGAGRVLRDLQVRRVPSAIAAEAVRGAYEDTDEVTRIEQYLERKYKAKDMRVFLAEPKNLASAFRRLRMAGYGASNSISVLKRYASQAVELEEPEASPDE